MINLRPLIILTILISLLIPLNTFAATTPQDRIALVIGNSSYKSSPLTNPAHDANDMAKALQDCDFKVTKILNANRSAMREAIREFGNQIKRGGVGLFYYAGHGIQVDGENYLVPVGTEVYSEAEVEDECLRVSSVLRQMELAGNRLNIIILDACRDNPFARSFRSSSRGLAKMDAPTGSILAYATAPGSVAADGVDKNGLYTSALLKHMMTPGTRIEQVFKLARIEVIEASVKKQVPWESSSLTGDFYFRDKSDEQRAIVPKEKMDTETQVTKLKPQLKPPPQPNSETQVSKITPQPTTKPTNDNSRISQDLEDAIGYYTGTIGIVDYTKAKPLFLKAAETGDPIAQMWLARCYHQGLSGFTENKTAAEKLASKNIEALKNLASKGHAAAMFLLASAYEEGLAITQDMALANKWYRSAAEKKDLMAMTNLGFISAKGLGVPQDDVLAVQWYRSASEKQFPPAMTNLGYMYEKGWGVLQDDVLAVQWYRNAAEKQFPPAMNNLGYMYEKGLGVSQDYNLAGYWYHKATAVEYKIAIKNLKQYTQASDGTWKLK